MNIRARTYTVKLTVRATPQEAGALRAKARAAGLSVARYVVETGLGVDLFT